MKTETHLNTSLIQQVKFVCNKITIWGREKAYTEFWWGSLKEIDHLEDPGVDGMIILRWIFRKWDVEVWTGSSWFRIGTSGGHL